MWVALGPYFWGKPQPECEPAPVLSSLWDRTGKGDTRRTTVQKAVRKIFGLTLTFKVGDDFRTQDYTARDVVLVRKGDIKILFGKITGKGKTHCPVIIFKGGDVEHFCGSSPDLNTRLQELLGEVPEELKVFSLDASVLNSECWRKYPNPAPRFGVKGREAGCKHGFMLARAYEQGGGKEIVLPNSPASSFIDAEEEEAFWDGWTSRFRSPVLLVGQHGSGKSFLAHKLAELAINEALSQGFQVRLFYIQGSPAVEAIALLGLVKRLPDGRFDLQPGALAKAFLFASEPQQKAVVLVEEIFRINPREQNLFVSAFGEVWRGGTPYYTLTHPDLAEWEVWVPTDRLWLIATGNLGSGYKYSTAADSALLDRFDQIWLKLTPERLAKFLEPILAEKGWGELLQPLIDLRLAAEALARNGELSTVPSLRTFRRIEHAERPEDVLRLFRKRFPASSWEERETWEEVLNRVLAPAIRSMS